MNELPSVALMVRFLAGCKDYGSEHLAVRIVVSGRNAGTPGLPESDDWMQWDADQMRAVVDYLERKRSIR